MSSFQFPDNYGYVFGVFGSSSVMNIYLLMNVAKARKQFGIQYPNLYAPPDYKNKDDADKFNSIQRAHQNTLESYSIVMLQMALCGLVYPITSAAFGFTWVLGRFVYGYGYAKGGPDGRMVGGILSHFGDLPLMIMTFKIGYDKIINKN